MDLITGKGPSARHEIFYFTESTLCAVRIDDFKYRFTDQPQGWLGGTVKVDWPILTNLRLDPYERTGMPQRRERVGVGRGSRRTAGGLSLLMPGQRSASSPRSSRGSRCRPCS